jgi:hypothetical protein
MLTPAAIRRHLDRLTKPPGSLGRFEDLAVRLCDIQQTLGPKTQPRRLVLFAAGLRATAVSLAQLFGRPRPAWAGAPPSLGETITRGATCSTTPATCRGPSTPTLPTTTS